MGDTRTEAKPLSQGVGAAIAAGVAARGGSERSAWWESSWALWLAAGLIVLATLAAFGNSFSGVFVFDDGAAIVHNATIRQLWLPWQALCPPANGAPVTGRPLLNLSLAVNYAISGEQVWSYHATNLAIHLLGALLLFGILRRTLSLPAMQQRWGAAAIPLALVIALMWAIHPLQTESVTYVVQRAESLGGLFYLLTMYCLIRGADSARATNFWYVGSALSCLLGMASKEVMVSAPLVVVLYDRAFLAGTFRAAWRRRWGLYVTLGATWLLLAWLVYGAANRGGTAGFGVGVSPWAYLGTQGGAVVHYLRLCVWPRPLVLDYGAKLSEGAGEIVPYAIVVGLLLAATVVALWRWPRVGFLGAWFFAILAPSSSIVPVRTQTVAEHRMYLPLAAVVAGVVLGGYVAGTWLHRRGTIPRWAWPALGGLLAVCATVVLGILTLQRNSDYRSLEWIWQDTIAKVPENERGYYNLANALLAAGKPTEAIEHYNGALRLQPDYPRAQNNLGLALVANGKPAEAVEHYTLAIGLAPDYAEAHTNLANALVSLGRGKEAIEQFREAVRLDPDFAAAHNNLGNALVASGRIDEAIGHFNQALRLKPDYAAAHNNLAAALAGLGRTDEAIEHYHEAVRLEPDFAAAHQNLANTLAGLGKTDEAVEHYEQCLRLKLDNADVHNRLGNALAAAGRADQAIEQYRQAVGLKLDYAEAHNNLAAALAGLGRTDEAIEHFSQALRLRPDYPLAQKNLALALTKVGRTEEAIAHYNRLLQLTPGSAEVHNSTAWLLATSAPAQGGDPARAVQLAERARGLAGSENASMLDTLAAAYAAAGRFAEAVATAEKAAELAESGGQAALAGRIRARLELYRANKPYRAAADSSGNAR